MPHLITCTPLLTGWEFTLNTRGSQSHSPPYLSTHDNNRDSLMGDLEAWERHISEEALTDNNNQQEWCDWRWGTRNAFREGTEELQGDWVRMRMWCAAWDINKSIASAISHHALVMNDRGRRCAIDQVIGLSPESQSVGIPPVYLALSQFDLRLKSGAPLKCIDL